MTWRRGFRPCPYAKRRVRVDRPPTGLHWPGNDLAPNPRHRAVNLQQPGRSELLFPIAADHRAERSGSTIAVGDRVAVCLDARSGARIITVAPGLRRDLPVASNAALAGEPRGAAIRGRLQPYSPLARFRVHCAPALFARPARYIRRAWLSFLLCDLQLADQLSDQYNPWST